MNDSNNSRRGFIRGITLVAGSIFLVTVRTGVGATKRVKAAARNNKTRGATAHFMEGNHLPIPGQDPALDSAHGDRQVR